MEFRLPPLGEGIDSAVVVGVLVKAGDTVKAGQNVLAVETDKAAVEVPAEADGTIGQVHAKPGDKLPVGGLVLTFSGSGATPAAPVAPQKAVEQAAPQPAQAETPPAPATGGGKVEMSLPSLGEGIDAATVVGVMVKVGDAVKAGQSILAVETDKAAVEVPAEADGVVEAIHVKQGQKVPVGQAVVTLKTSGGSVPAPAANPTAQVQPAASSNGSPAKASVASAPTATLTKKDLTPAGPATRRLARELGVALAEVKPTGRGGRVTLDDIKGFVKAERQTKKPGGGNMSGGTVADSFAHPPMPDFAKFGTVEKKAVSNIRMAIARNLTIAVRTMPTVTQNDLCDITDLEAGRKRIVENLPKGAPKITWTVLAVKAVVAVLKEFPHFNSSFDMNAGELILKKYFNIGIAVDTERGLVVPVIRDADKKTIRDLAVDVATMAEKARTGKLAIDEMRGGTFTITNLGGIGGTTFTPIVNYPEVAILGLSKSTLQPVVKDGQIVPRLMMPLSLTYDHRVIDGADGARFTTRLAQLFSDPIRLLMES
ncbi:2-oxo acid dehydrogenase subunit E2 [Limnoglobus roseus]|uniref:Dihydrolipoamide acetyltransferase component of pyruvate dehydrogenase complex n=1 Tax=Limnoglobus roseus TaxID=2598579 RepID=A0A5C1AQH8_9BACT|nr:2-oxo acid dehydrogenase subunit E2 [Limnoglobus roseus]QEL19108.1 pyruvate dehydrogenase [Limnoglobus roseus]